MKKGHFPNERRDAGSKFPAFTPSFSLEKPAFFAFFHWRNTLSPSEKQVFPAI